LSWIISVIFDATIQQKYNLIRTQMLDQLITITKEAGELFKEGFYANKEIQYKSSIDLVTQYDLQIEEFLKKRLAQDFSDFTLIGEETSQTITHPNKAIYIDPIDGTTNFIHGLPMCCISIGVWVDQEPYIGVVYNPIMNELFTAQKAKGSFLNGKPLKVSQTDTLQESLIATGFPYTKIDKGRDYQWVLECMEAVLPLSRDIRRFGSAALDLCLLAKGSFDLYYEVNLKPWDVAAGILILLEAGGKVSTDTGYTYTLEDRVIVASNSEVHQDFIDILPNL